MKIKNLLLAGSIATMIALTSATAFASPANPGVPARDGSGGRAAATGAARTNDGVGRGQGGKGRGLGIGGKMLQDGSCYTTTTATK